VTNPVIRHPSRTNQALFERRRNRAEHNHHELKSPVPDLDRNDLIFAGRVVHDWFVGYGYRKASIEDIQDIPGRELLIARHRARNNDFRDLPDFTEDQFEYVTRIFEEYGKRSDVSSLTDLPSYGPSFLAIWDSVKMGLPDREVLDHFRLWRCAKPPAWDRESRFDLRVARRLRSELIWTKTGDNDFPWEIRTPRSHLQVRLNNYPDEWMYSLFVNGECVGDFHDWPECWNRGEDPTKAEIEAAIDPATLLSRYVTGDCQPVWRDLVLLGDAILRPPFRKPAGAVARETMRRVRRNLETIIGRLEAMYYRFDGVPMRRRTPEEKKVLAGMELPLSLRAWYEEVGVVNFRGVHRKLCPPEVRAGRIAEPLEMKWPPQKVRPAAVADFRRQGDPSHRFFTEYLRHALRWGGFPGWQVLLRSPDKEIAILRRELGPF
jgi:hypothetical protein